MKRFVIRLMTFLLLMFIIDRGVGLGMKYMQEHARGGYIGHHNKIINHTDEDILIFGSSRAIHHYNPQTFKDSLGMSCYNCGQDGNGIILFYGWWQLMKDRHIPQIVIYDVNPGFDLLLGESNQKYLGWLRGEYDNNDVKQIFEKVDYTEKYKMQSMMYRYNSKFLQNIVDYVHPIFKIKSDGFLPLKGELDEMKLNKNRSESKQPKIDSLKIELIEKIVIDIKKHHAQIIFVASPVWYGKEDEQFEALGKICKENGVLFLNYSNSPKYVRNNMYFKDGSHLNARGADEFTKDLVKDLQKRKECQN